MKVTDILLSQLPANFTQGHHLSKRKVKSAEPTTDSEHFESILFEYMSK